MLDVTDETKTQWRGAVPGLEVEAYGATFFEARDNLAQVVALALQANSHTAEVERFTLLVTTRKSYDLAATVEKAKQ